MYRLFIVLLLLTLGVLKVSAQEESTPSATTTIEAPGNSGENPSTKDDEAHLRNELRKQEAQDTQTPAPQKLIPGDANEDNRVDEADYAIWHNFYKQSVSQQHKQGDFNNDSITDGIDYTIWLANLGQAANKTSEEPSPTKPGKGPKQ